MKRLLLLVLICWSSVSMAQMQAAQKIIPDYTHETQVKSTPVKIWRVIRDLPQVKEYSNGMIREVNIRTVNDTKFRDLVFSDGRKRTDEIEQVHDQYKFFVFHVQDPLPAGIRKAVVTALVESLPDKDDVSVVRWSIILEGDKSGRKPLVETLSAEIANYEAGLKKMLE
ncbi:SRPBCC family protein [Chitinophaga qingshengii]|uniref:SRPBCC family protein n=1 Tax=Chitinophaga qingshengii TaxID=1569794 RepID=A0ABR7TFN8_9BACT|nr:SRPBCC family protein [Chitinophaga qingshengii]MBC9929183.1 SRPBCC family protein [Chitinophaga qingshengii]